MNDLSRVVRLFHELAAHYFVLENRVVSLRQDAAGLAALFDEERSRKQRLSKRYADRSAYRVLDAGCAGGEHAAALSRAGFDVEGADLSPEMIDLARRNFPDVYFYVSDLRSLADRAGSEPIAPYDAVFSLFGTLGYLHDDDSIHSAFTALAHIVRPGGLFACEVWHRGPYELLGSSPPLTPPRRVSMEISDGRLERERRVAGMVTQGPAAFTVISHEYKLVTPGGKAQAFHEEHRMRLFAAEELEALAAPAGWKLRDVFADTARTPFQEHSGALFCVLVRL